MFPISEPVFAAFAQTLATPVDPAGAKDRQFEAQIAHGIDQSKLAKLLGGWPKASFGVCEILHVEVNSHEKVLIWQIAVHFFWGNRHES